MSTSYQNGDAPQKIEELGISAEELQRRKSNRKLLFTSIVVAGLLAMAVLTYETIGHQQEAHYNRASNFWGDEEIEFRGDPDREPINHKVASLVGLDSNTKSSVPTGCETTVLLMRHCEKEGRETIDEHGNQHCSYVGYERAHFIPTLFGGEAATSRWPVPSQLYALTTERSHHKNFRELETLVPLANKYGLEIDSSLHGNGALAKKVFQKLATGEWCGKTVVVSWKHEKMGDLGRRLACGDCKREYPVNEFDEVWQLRYVYDVNGMAVIRNHGILEDEATGTTNSTSTSSPSKTATAATSDTADDSSGLRARRSLSKHKKTSHKEKKAGSPAPPKEWSVYSSVSHQNFDPLAFSFSYGDFNKGGDIATGGKWFASGDDRGEM